MAQHRSAPRRANEGGRGPSRASRTPSTWAWSTAASGRPPTPAAPGSRSSTSSRPDRSAGSPSRPSDPNIVYVGSGEGLPRPDLAVGDGVYQIDRRRQDLDASRPARRAADSEARDRSEATRTACSSPRSAIPTGPNEERGIFRSTDGGQTFRARAVQGREHRRQGRRHRSVQPRHRLRHDVGAAAGTVGKRRLAGHQRRHLQVDRRRHDLEAADAGAAATASINAELGDRAERIRGASIATVEAGDERHRASTDPTTPARPGRASPPTSGRPAASTRRCRTCTRPIPDTLIVTDIVSYKSTDGGRTFVPFKGAPGGDDNQNIWWNPNNPDIMLLVVDQGAVVTLNGGETWSSWYTQPTAALYHVMTDNAFPYRVCGGQQDSGSVCIASRGNDGQITFREWHPVGVEEYGYAAPDPRDPDLVYGGKVDALRPAHRPGVGRRPGPARAGRRRRRLRRASRSTARCARSRSCSRTVDPHALFYAQQRAVEDARRRHQLDADQPGPDARDVGRAEERRHLRRRACRRASAARSARR